MSRKYRVLVLVHESLVPPPLDQIDAVSDEEFLEFKAGHHVDVELRARGHDVRILGLLEELKPLREAIQEFKPHVVFNLLEEFRSKPTYDYYMVNYLELHRTRFTGCGAPGLFLARDKALSKKILTYHRVRVPRFMVVPRNRKAKRVKGLGFPLIVKCLNEEASLGISQASVVHSDDKLAERVEYVHRRLGRAAIVEEFIPGRELYMGVIGNQRLTTFPVWELRFDAGPEGRRLIATEKAKWDLDYQERHGITAGPADLGPEKEAEIQHLARRIYRRLGLTGYARIDFRMREDGEIFFLEANPNPDISSDEEFASAAAAAGLAYGDLLEKILRLGMSRKV